MANSVLASVDQLFTLLVRRDPKLKAFVYRCRELLHRCIFLKPVPSSELPPLVQANHELARLDLFDPYDGQPMYFAACEKLLARDKEMEEQILRLRRSLLLNKQSTLFFQRQNRKTVLEKAFVGWRMQVRQEHAEKRHRSSALEEREKMEFLKEESRKLSSKYTSLERQSHNQITTLENERHSLQSEVTMLGAQLKRAKKEMERLSSILEQLQAQSQMQNEENMLIAERLTDFLRMFSLSAADSPWERWNRKRVHSLTKKPSSSTLIDWARLITRNFPDAPKAVFGQPQSGSAASYVLLLYCLSPGDIPYSSVQQAFRASEDAQWDTLRYYANLLQLSGPDLDSSSTKYDHTLFLVSLFQRFAGNGAQIEFKPPCCNDEKVWTNAVKLFSSFATDQEDDLVQSLEMRKMELAEWSTAGQAVSVMAMASGAIESEFEEASKKVALQQVNIPISSIAAELHVDVKSLQLAVTEQMNVAAAALRQAHRFYSDPKLSETVPTVDLVSFQAMLADAQIDSERITPSAVATIFQRCCRNKDGLTLSSFFEALIHVAASLCPTSTDFATKIGEVVQSISNKSRRSLLAEQHLWCDRPEITQLLQQSETALKELFQKYSQGDELIEEAFLQLCSDAHLLADQRSVLSFLFHHVPDREVAQFLSAQSIGDFKWWARGLRYKEFLRVLCAVAAVSNPFPWLSYFERLNTVLKALV